MRNAKVPGEAPRQGGRRVNFFITRPIFAMSIALVMILAGVVAMLTLPIRLVLGNDPKVRVTLAPAGKS